MYKVDVKDSSSEKIFLMKRVPEETVFQGSKVISGNSSHM